MARNDWYTVNEHPDHFLIVKVDPDDRTPRTDRGEQNLPTQYKVAKEGGAAGICECFAGFKFCRHKQMIIEFQKTERVNQRWLYNFDRKKWLPPLTQE
jgi:hypothetical protein